jgi:hypothetical protein
MIGKNQVALALDGNPDMQAIFAGKTPGTEIELRVCGKISEVTADQAVISITEVESDEEPTKSEDDSEGESPKVESPDLVMVRGKSANALFEE